MRRQGVDHGQDGGKSHKGLSEVGGRSGGFEEAEELGTVMAMEQNVSPKAGEGRMTEGQCGCGGVDERKIINLIPYVSRHTLAHC